MHGPWASWPPGSVYGAAYRSGEITIKEIGNKKSVSGFDCKPCFLSGENNHPAWRQPRSLFLYSGRRRLNHWSELWHRRVDPFSALDWLVSGIDQQKIILIGASGYQAGSYDNWLTSANNEILALGFGRINSLAFTLSLITVFCFYGLRSDQKSIIKALYALACTSSYTLCLQTGSRMAAGVPLIAALAAFAISRKDYIPNRTTKRIQTLIISATIGLITLLIWVTAIKPDIAEGMANEKLRFSFWQCWLQNSVFAGNGKIIHGVGYNLRNMVNACNNQSADSGLIQIIGQHGFLGLLAIGLLPPC